MKMKVLDLFSGVGGFSLGLERTGGFETVAFCEIDPFCRQVLAQYWPEVPILDDVRTAEFPAAAVIVGGFPCTDVSRAGKRAGITGEHSGLYRELVRAIRLVGPRYAIVENVAALLSDGMGDVLGDLAEGGACVEWDCVPAEAIGAPHERDRVWIVRHAPDAAGADDWRGDGAPRVGQEPESGSGAGEAIVADAPGVGCGQRGQRRPPDSFAWVRNATRGDFADADSARFQVRESISDYPREELAPIERSPCVDVWQQRWPCEPALLGVDDGIPNRMDRVKALGNTLLPQIPDLIGRAILEAHR
jgi:DNA (cytosine-5)-methyltransferase 1